MPAKVPGHLAPVDALCSSSRFTETPTAPAATPSATSSAMRLMSSSVAGSLAAPRSPITNARTAPCGICAATSMRAGDAVERVEVLADRLPVPLDGLAQRRAGNALDAFHQADQPVVAVGGGGREADAAVAHDHGGDAVPDRRREQRVPGDLAVVVRVHVDEAGRDGEAGGVDLLATGVVDGARPR